MGEKLMATRADTTKFMSLLMPVFRKVSDSGSSMDVWITIWHDQLGEYTSEQVERCANWVLRKRTDPFFPLPAEIHIIMENMKRPSFDRLSWADLFGAKPKTDASKEIDALCSKRGTA